MPKEIIRKPVNKCFNYPNCNNEATTEFCPECLMNGGIKVKETKGGLTKQDLINVFSVAREKKLPFVFVSIEAEGIKEVIAVPSESFVAKEKFYNKAYSDELVHVMNSKVRITNIIAGETEALHYI